MAIDYKAEVDSGFDRKLMIEKIITGMLASGVPTSYIKDNPDFIKYRHSEMKQNLEKRFNARLDQLQDKYEQTLLDENGEVDFAQDEFELQHQIHELYPIENWEEHLKLFEKKIQLDRLIEKKKNDNIKTIEKEIKSIERKISSFVTKNPKLSIILDFIDELDKLEEQGKLEEESSKLLKKYNIDNSVYPKLNKIYEDYNALLRDKQNANEELSLLKDGKVMDDEIENLVEISKETETELIQRNLKLINYFIRSNYKDVYMDVEEEYGHLLEELIRCVRTFDPSYKVTFSTYCFKCFDTKIKRSFKELTGYKWEKYWGAKSIKACSKEFEEISGKKPTAEDLYNLGILTCSLDDIKYALNEVSIVPQSWLPKLPFAETTDYLTDAERDSMAVDDYEGISSSAYSTGLDSKYDLEISDDSLDSVVDIMYNSDKKDLYFNLLKEEIGKVLGTLTEREKKVLILRFGLDDSKPRRLEDIGDEWGVTRERIHQIEVRALRKLRHPSRSRKLKDYYNDSIENVFDDSIPTEGIRKA